jgi:hypothetical protein
METQTSIQLPSIYKYEEIYSSIKQNMLDSLEKFSTALLETFKEKGLAMTTKPFKYIVGNKKNANPYFEIPFTPVFFKAVPRKFHLLTSGNGYITFILMEDELNGLGTRPEWIKVFPEKLQTTYPALSKQTEIPLIESDFPPFIDLLTKWIQRAAE